ncbi:hypothetical protein ACSYAD_27140 [Acaryochloris marina NIES-2412]|uniref:hypothetical protein n=1 Tax=Acaryochloris marina TaxID=155978 RepID=UPI004059ACD3
MRLELILFVWLIIISSIYVLSIQLALALSAFDVWFLLLLASSLFSVTLLYFCRSKKWRYLLLIQPVVVLIAFYYGSPIRPFLSFYFSLQQEMTLPQVRAAVRQNYEGTSFPLPSEENWKSSEEETKARISQKLYLVEPGNYLLDCDGIVISFNPKGKVISARYSSLLVPEITNS